MNGRVYNPIISRFISPDPYIPQPYNGQSYNRYSYVLNNPLRYTDPSGYTPEPIEEIVVISVRRPELRPPSMDFSYLHFSSIPHMPQFGTRSYGRPVNPPLSQQMMYYLYGTIGNFGALTHEGPRMAQGASLDPQQSRENPPGVDNGKFGGGGETGVFGRALLGGSDGSGSPVDVDMGRTAVERARRTFGRFLAKSEYADLMLQFDNATFEFINEDRFRSGRRLIASAEFDRQHIYFYNEFVRQEFSYQIFVVGHEFRHLQPVNHSLDTIRNQIQYSYDAHPAEIDASRWSGRVICQDRGTC